MDIYLRQASFMCASGLHEFNVFLEIFKLVPRRTENHNLWFSIVVHFLEIPKGKTQNEKTKVISYIDSNAMLNQFTMCFYVKTKVEAGMMAKYIRVLHKNMSHC